MDSLIPRLRLLTEEHLAQLEASEPPTTLWEMNDARWDLLEECRLDPDRPASEGYERKSDRQVSTTDPDAVAMKSKGERATLGYHIGIKIRIFPVWYRHFQPHSLRTHGASARCSTHRCAVSVVRTLRQGCRSSPIVVGAAPIAPCIAGDFAYLDAYGATLGYHNHYMIDGGKARIILNALVTPANVMESTPMLPLLRRAIFRWRVRPKQVVADTTYGTAENIRELEESGIRAHVPLPDWDQRTPYYGASLFTYDLEQDRYSCPQGATLRRRKANHTTRKIVIYRADAAVCKACSVKGDCTASDHGRQIARSFDAE